MRCRSCISAGQLDWAEIQAATASLAEKLGSDAALVERYHPFAYLHEMGAALAAADLVVTRSGAATLGELPLFGLPAVLTPYPHAWRYQQVNALYLQERGAARILPDSELAQGLLPLVRELIRDGEQRQKMRLAMQSLAQPDASSKIASLHKGAGRPASPERDGRMIGLVIVFYMFLGMFGFIGSQRGWAKELLVTFSIVLGMALIAVMENLMPILGPFLKSNPVMQYWVRILIILAMTFFGYQSPKLTRLTKASEKRDRIQDALLGLFMGLLSGFFVVGTLWSYSNGAGYPGLGDYITAPPQNLAQATENIIKILPPAWLVPPWIYIAVVMAFIFVIVVFI